MTMEERFKEEHLESLLVLSTAHMPSTEPDFGHLRVTSFEYGFFVCTTYPGIGVPDWILPVMTWAWDEGCTFILFDRDASRTNQFQTWNW